MHQAFGGMVVVFGVVFDYLSIPTCVCVCSPLRPTALRSCALSADYHLQSLMPQSVVTLSGKASWTV